MSKRLIVSSNTPKVDIYLSTEISETTSFNHLVSKHIIIEIPEKICVAGSEWEKVISTDLDQILGPETCIETKIKEQVRKKICSYLYSAILY